VDASRQRHLCLDLTIGNKLSIYRTSHFKLLGSFAEDQGQALSNDFSQQRIFSRLCFITVPCCYLGFRQRIVQSNQEIKTTLDKTVPLVIHNGHLSLRTEGVPLGADFEQDRKITECQCDFTDFTRRENYSYI
jgi:hypothetical protein